MRGECADGGTYCCGMPAETVRGRAWLEVFTVMPGGHTIGGGGIAGRAYCGVGMGCPFIYALCWVEGEGAARNTLSNRERILRFGPAVAKCFPLPLSSAPSPGSRC